MASFIVELQLTTVLGLTGAPSKPRHGLRAASLPVYPELSASHLRLTGLCTRHCGEDSAL